MLCHDMLTSKAAMAKHIEFIYGMDNEPNSKSHPACVFIVEIPIPPKRKLTDTYCVTLGKKTKQLGCEHCEKAFAQ